MATTGAFDLTSTFLRLRPDASIEPLSVDANFWPRLIANELGSFHHEYLVSCHAFDADWPTWEVHPHGDEIVCLLSGAVVLVLERGAAREEIPLGTGGAFVLVPKGVWHTAKVAEPSRMLFITAGEGTQHRACAE